MTLSYRSIRQPLIRAILLCLLTGVAALAWKWFSKPDPEAAIIKHTMQKNPDDVLKYWTEDKKRKARPARMPQVDSLKPKPAQDFPSTHQPPRS